MPASLPGWGRFRLQLSWRRCASPAWVRLDDSLVAEVANRLGIFCYSFLDYDRAIEQFEVALAAAERAGDAWKTYRQLHNIADALLLAVHQDRASGRGGRSLRPFRS